MDPWEGWSAHSAMRAGSSDAARRVRTRFLIAFDLSFRVLGAWVGTWMGNRRRTRRPRRPEIGERRRDTVVCVCVCVNCFGALCECVRLYASCWLHGGRMAVGCAPTSARGPVG